MMIIPLVLKYLPDLLKGALVTLALTFAALAIGSVLGTLLALVRMSRRSWMAAPAIAYIEFFRTTPFLVQVLWIYFVLPIIIRIDLDANTAGILSLGLNTAAFMAEIFRAGIQAIDQGQRDACSVLGLTKRQTFHFVVFPQAIRIVLPPIGTTAILVLKGSSLLAVIGVLELTYRATLMTQMAGRYLEVFSLTAGIYMLIIIPATVGVNLLEKRLRAGYGRPRGI